ncbi:MAG TPA: GxxExxY protein [Tepidisphaeraceae bacterium]|nr:GxxExxY protein [Tepidisphaeraceae bacterium]
MSDQLLFRDECYAIVGAAMAVHNELGAAFLEAVYHEAMEIELRERGIPFQSQVALPITYKGHVLRKAYIADFICFGKIIVEIKAISRLSKTDSAQAINYLAATGLRLAVLINFGDPARLDWERIIL